MQKIYRSAEMIDTFYKHIMFDGVPRKCITKEAILTLVQEEKKRVCFAHYQPQALKRDENDVRVGVFKVPFSNTIYPLFRRITGFDLFPSRYGDGYYRYVESEGEYAAIKRFIDEYQELVFLRDNLDLSLAMGMHCVYETGRTRLGELEYQAKYNGDEKAMCELSEMCDNLLSSLPFYTNADMIVAMPSTRCLPENIVSRLTKFEGEKVVKGLCWGAEKSELKNITDNTQKVEALDATELNIDVDVKGKVVVLLDDMYKTGTTMQYVAMKLKEAGANRVFGFSIVKSLSDKTKDDEAKA